MNEPRLHLTSAVQNRAPETSERKSFPARVRDYLHEVRVELRKVTWPTREQMIAFTTVTLITSTAAEATNTSDGPRSST